MLISIYIKNLAIIEETNIIFEKGLNILTGETGSGKSLLVKAIKLLAGGKFSKDLLRYKTNRLVVEGVFDYFQEIIEIRRVYDIKGTTKSYINDQPVSNKRLIEYTRKLIDMHGQHDHQNLLDSSTHLSYLDAFGNYSNLLDDFNNTYKKIKNNENCLEELISKENSINDKKELYQFQLNELTLYPLSKEYENELNNRFKIINNIKHIKDSIFNILLIMDKDENNILKSINTISNNFNKLSDLDEYFFSFTKRLESVSLELEDILSDLQNYNSNTNLTDGDSDLVNEKIAHLELLKRKYGGTLDNVLNYLEEIKNTEQIFINYKKEIKVIKQENESLKIHLNDLGRSLTNKRNKIAKKLENDIQNNLNILSMPDVKFKICITTDDKHVNIDGFEKCEFYISTNIGEELKPVSKIASGGEISRIMLAIKMSLQSKDIVQTLVFDEIDSGISGAVAEKVGQAIDSLSKTHQIICITHLSQIASKGKCHFSINKNKKSNRINVEIDKLNDLDRINQIAYLISDSNITATSKKQARQLLKLNG